jgi:hypothetical protein
MGNALPKRSQNLDWGSKAVEGLLATRGGRETAMTVIKKAKTSNKKGLDFDYSSKASTTEQEKGTIADFSIYNIKVNS